VLGFGRIGAGGHAGVTTGKVHDAKVMVNLIREDDTAVYGDKGYASEEKKRAAEDAGVLWAVKEKAKPGRTLTKRHRARNRRFGKVRAKVEHVFRVIKCQFGYRKVRYRGIVKNGAQMFALFALANLYLVRRRIASA
jgi:IS5 family transposase